MQYKCPKCAAVSEQPGNCAACNVPMVESTVVAPEQPAVEAAPSEVKPEAAQ